MAQAVGQRQVDGATCRAPRSAPVATGWRRGTSCHARRQLRTVPQQSAARRARARCAAVADTLGSDTSSSTTTSTTCQPIIRRVTAKHYFPVAELHTTCFQHHSSPADKLWKAFDRVWALQINDDLARRGAGRYVLLLALDPARAPQELLELPDALQEAADAAADAAATAAGAGSSRAQQQPASGAMPSRQAAPAARDAAVYGGQQQLPPQFAFPGLGFWLSRLVDRTVWPGLGREHDQLGILGVAQVDTFGDIIPPRTLSPERDGAIGWVPRQGYAYISNVAVSPRARRQGVAVTLVRRAEAVAAAWGCSKAALNVNETNTAAVALYRRLGYKQGPLEAPWMPFLQGRPPDRCIWMVKLLKLQKQTQQTQQQPTQQQPTQQQQQQQELVAGTASSVLQQQ